MSNTGQDPSGAGSSSRLASPPPGTNSAGTAQSSGVTTGSATGAATGTEKEVDAAINEENKTIDRKLKGICSGC
ncbi:hypothetical protein ACFIOY_32850 [Bradyrhizobium sp. TZ2]